MQAYHRKAKVPCEKIGSFWVDLLNVFILEKRKVMGIYVVIEAIVGVVGGLLLAICTKKAEGVSYGRLDRAGQATNILLTIAYLLVSPMYLFLGFLAQPMHDGFLGVLGWIVATICASVVLFSGLGLGASVALRKRGKSKLSFGVQFAGAAAFMLMLLLFMAFYGTLLQTLN